MSSFFVVSILLIPTAFSCRPDVSGFQGADVEARQLRDDPRPHVLATAKPADALTFNTVSLAPLPTLPPIPSLSDLLKLPQPLNVDNSILQMTSTSLSPLSAVSSTTPSPLFSSTIIDDVNGNKITEDDKAGNEEINSSGNGTNNEEDATNATGASSTIATVTSTSTTTTKITTTEPPKDECPRATVTAITLMPYNDQLVAVDKERIKQQIILLESYTQIKLQSFGPFAQEAINVDGQFALEYRIQHVKNCADLRDYATKAVSYSREIERILFTCHCEPMWIIAKRRSG
ncbi:unnamed protein product [Bursaphelenchus xylophilus]|uniref:(pine wood nematode) hypothetical protein n=1 Tax=Bursaphelenchus xylophilus TaxID=6326 RepID=A0A1I7RRP6_BURXY|nr:unnamed protein product [Bursaphelenchus xylophilus]CAG9123578.1 unnamed protein product [Bursaphelenchus xylophilus]